MKDNSCGCLSRVSLGFALGLFSAIYMMLFAWFAYYNHVGADMVALWGSVVPGYTASITGGLIGGFWGFIEGFVSGFLIAWFYNMCARCRMCCFKSDDK